MFTKDGEGFYLSSPCEFERFSLSAKRMTAPRCQVDLPEGARPKPPQPQEPQGGREVEGAEAGTSADSPAPKEVAEEGAKERAVTPAKLELDRAASPPLASPKEESSEGGEDDKGGLDSPPDR